MSSAQWDEFRSRADRALEARTSWALERQLAWGTFQDGNPFLADSDMTAPAGFAAVPAVTAVAYLEGFLALRGQQGVIHVTPEVATYLGLGSFVVDGQQLRTLAGTPVVVGAGYSNQDGADNLDPSGSSAAEAAAGQSWVFASSPVVYRTSEILALPETVGEALDRSDNTVIYRAERDLWVAFDGGPHAGVLADWTP